MVANPLVTEMFVKLAGALGGWYKIIEVYLIKHKQL